MSDKAENCKDSHHSDLDEMFQQEKVKKSKKQKKKDGSPVVPLPIKVKMEKVNKNGTGNKSNDESSADTGDETMIPAPIRVKAELKKRKRDIDSPGEELLPKKKLKKDKNSTSYKVLKPSRNKKSESEHSIFDSENSDSELMVPIPKIIKSEQQKRRSTKTDDSDSSEQTVPRPIIVKREAKLNKKSNKSKNDSTNKIKKQSANKNLESEYSSSDSENLGSGPMVPLPKVIKTEQGNINSSRNQNVNLKKSDKSDDSDSSEETVPRPKIIKSEPQSNSNTSGSDGESDLESDGSVTVRSKMEYLNSIDEKTPQKKKSLLERVQSKYPNAAKHPIALDIPQKNNCFLLRVPKTIDPAKLVHLPWELDKNLKFKLLNEKDKYVIKPLNENPDPCYVIAHMAKVLNINKIYSVTKHVSKKQGINFELPTKTTVPLPDSIKTRHPLFGINYKHQIKLRKDVKSRLKEAVENLRKRNLKEIKKNNSIKVKKELEESSSELILDMLNSHTSRKK